MIKSIELSNWKTHKRTLMSFQKGVNVLIGVMGAGKSSVIDAMSFGLFGTFPSLSHKRTTTENLISNRPELLDNAEVKLSFSIGSDEYTVTRKISRGEATSAKLEKNGNYLQSQPGRVNEEIGSVIKVDYDTFSRAVYAEQNRIDYFLGLTKAERKRQIDQMLGLDNFAKAEENSTSLINSIKSIVNEEERILLQTDLNEEKSRLEELSREKQKMELEQKALIERASEGEKTTKKLNSELSEMKLKNEKSKKLEREIAEMSSKIETLNRELDKIKKMGIDQKAIESEFGKMTSAMEVCDERIRKLRKEESDILKEIANAEYAVKTCKSDIEKRDVLLESINGKDPNELASATEEKESTIKESVRELASLKGRKDELEKTAESLRKHISKCPVCERVLDEQTRKVLLDQKDKRLEEAKESIKKLESAISKDEKGLSVLKKDVEKVKLATAKVKEYKDVEKLLDESSGKAKELRETHSRITGDMEKSTKERETINKELGDIRVKMDAAKRKEKYVSEIRTTSETLEKKKKENSEIRFDEKELYKLQELITAENSRLNDAKGRIIGNERYIKGIDAQIDDKMRGIANINSIRERIESRRRHMANMGKFKNALVETEAQLRNSLVTSINSLMQNVWVELYPYADYSGIRLNAKKDDYVLEASTGLGRDGKREWMDIDGMASGGERSIACLTMRIALAMVIVPNLRWLILDEPTHNIDENGISKFIDVLGTTLPNVVEQIFIITHDSALKNISSARVYSLERNKDRNEYTSVVEL